MLRLYTARYSHRALASHPAGKVRITRRYPQFKLRYQLAGTVRELAPTEDEWDLERMVFDKQYRQRLDEIGVDAITSKLGEIAGGGGTHELVVLCFEDLRLSDEWCHRRVFAEWWRDRTGQEVFEIPEPPGSPSPRPRRWAAGPTG